MPKYSRSHERAERAKISRGLWESLFGFLFSWLPGVGLILAMAGFCRQAVRLTEAHKVKRFFAMAFASVVLVVAIGVLVGEAYQYSRNPDIVSQTGLWIWQKVTGQAALPGTDGEDYYPVDEGDVPDEYFTGDDYQMEEGDVPVGDDYQMEEGDVPVSEGDFQDDIDFSEDDSDEESGDSAASAPESTVPPLSDLLKNSGVTVG